MTNKKWRLKSCPRCNGDLFLQETDYYSQYVCLQCGYIDHNNEVVFPVTRVLNNGKRFYNAVDK